ncbi:tRNA-guanine transglycosylase DpdA [Neobacillus sp.]|uniref:tRNA-guanine transglycosylase DpdA n=1 Tax=Neobacillus sp. TaxID=2675273 RepID=UPI00289B0B25|nr:tRNA-guanine transglycosylase DpdA [Neobacillus sp.]
MVRTLVITSCTGEKLFKPENQLLLSDFRDKESLKNKEENLHEYKTTAGKLYTGKQHKRLMEGVELLREQYGEEIIDVSIVSAGYGLIDEADEIVPYEVTFNDMKAKEVIEWSDFLNINFKVSEKIKDYDLVFFLLGDQYLKSIQLPLERTIQGQKLIFLASKSSRKVIPNAEPYHRLEITQDDTKEFGSGNIELKGFLFKLIAQEMVNDKNLFDRIYKNPNDVLKILEKYRMKKNIIEQMHLFPLDYQVKTESSGKDIPSLQEKKIDIFRKSDIVAKNYKNFPLRYYMPENDDRVDPNFNFIEDTHTENRDPYLNDVYSHEIYNIPNYDGLLVSMMNIDSKKTIDSQKNKKFQKVIDAGGIHNFVRYPSDFPILGDCGAYSYRNYFEPPFGTKEILDNYEMLGFDIGVSIDHLILPEHSEMDERIRRLSITESNAERFIKLHNEGSYTFKPSGIAQGWDVPTYVQSVKNLIDMGYQHISLGGLAFSPNEVIYDVLKNIAPLLPEYMEVHLFGAARLESINTFNQLGVTSFDSTSFLRQAWLSAKNNYFTMDGAKYAAIRVPQATERSSKIKKLLVKGVGSLELFKKLEQKSLEALRLFDKGQLGIEETLETILEYDNLMNFEKRNNNEKLYRKVLEDTPWKKCGCEICKEVGIEVIIFRGNNRNRRRGFHNTHVFYQQFKENKQEGLKI